MLEQAKKEEIEERKKQEQYTARAHELSLRSSLFDEGDMMAELYTNPHLEEGGRMGGGGCAESMPMMLMSAPPPQRRARAATRLSVTASPAPASASFQAAAAPVPVPLSVPPTQAVPQPPQQQQPQKEAEGAFDLEEGTRDFTKVPREMDQQFEKLDTDGALRPTIIKPGDVWKKRAQKALLASPVMTSLGEDEQREERNAAFDLLDALTKS
eukprot:CAMPEP_0168504968 /NCGR_PEP_ID=MMETSP0228-20121227/76631_1 /TAXON_ID=133427 /ORGANISM="Protoceratium reticulatum, Strain CCCM 535 (=CCMP 1889)" /LENGTH=211 /DNA_ID=CAMNT_0008522045 /DNA_START=1 /DNA_END=632 /DNA_ORIENTATION=+